TPAPPPAVRSTGKCLRHRPADCRSFVPPTTVSSLAHPRLGLVQLLLDQQPPAPLVDSTCTCQRDYPHLAHRPRTALTARRPRPRSSAPPPVDVKIANPLTASPHGPSAPDHGNQSPPPQTEPPQLQTDAHPTTQERQRSTRPKSETPARR